MGALPAEFFRRQDEGPDASFYAVARPSTHIDAEAAEVLQRWYRELLPGGALLDLCAGACSHLEGARRAVGLGLDATALARNPHLSESVLHDINADPTLPFVSRSFAAAMCNLSVQYLTQPSELFREVARCLVPGAPFFVAFGNRMFPSKAVLAWRASNEAAHLRLVDSYFAASGSFGATQHRVHTPPSGTPLVLVWAHALASPEAAND